MSCILEQDSKDNKSSQDTEYISESEPESEEAQGILSEIDQEYLLLDIQFPLPYTFPKPYLTLNEVALMLDNALPKFYVLEQHITGDPDEALSYIINQFNIDRVSQSIRDFPRLDFEQVYYLTYIDTS